MSCSCFGLSFDFSPSLLLVIFWGRKPVFVSFFRQYLHVKWRPFSLLSLDCQIIRTSILFDTMEKKRDWTVSKFSCTDLASPKIRERNPNNNNRQNKSPKRNVILYISNAYIISRPITIISFLLFNEFLH